MDAALGGELRKVRICDFPKVRVFDHFISLSLDLPLSKTERKIRVVRLDKMVDVIVHEVIVTEAIAGVTHLETETEAKAQA